MLMSTGAQNIFQEENFQGVFPGIFSKEKLIHNSSASMKRFHPEKRDVCCQLRLQGLTRFIFFSIFH